MLGFDALGKLALGQLPQASPPPSHWMGLLSRPRLPPVRPLLLASYRQNQASDASFLPTQPETNTNFIGKTRQTARPTPALLRQNPASDADFLPTQPQTNTHFIGKTKPQIVTVLQALRQNFHEDFPPPAQAGTNVSFVGKTAP